MRPLGEVSQALLQALALSGRATLRELSAHAQISAVDARYALKNLRRATLVCIVDTARVADRNRPVAVYALVQQVGSALPQGVAANDDGYAVLKKFWG